MDSARVGRVSRETDDPSQDFSAARQLDLSRVCRHADPAANTANTLGYPEFPGGADRWERRGDEEQLRRSHGSQPDFCIDSRLVLILFVSC